MTKRRPIPIAAIETPEADVDWQWIELDYREGVMSVLDIAIENNVASGAILRRARQEGWERAAASVTKRHVQTSTDNESRRMNSRDDVPELDVEGLALEPEKPPRLSIDLDDL